MQKTLATGRELRESERRRVESSAQLLQRIAFLDTPRISATDGESCVDALKRPGVRGGGESCSCKRVVELAGMVEHCDFEEQHTVTNGDGDSPHA